MTNIYVGNLDSTAVVNTSHCPVGITGAIVSNGWGDDVVGFCCAVVQENSTHVQTHQA